MATLYPAHSAMNWSEAKWSLADDDAQDQYKPGRTVTFDYDGLVGGPFSVGDTVAESATGEWAGVVRSDDGVDTLEIAVTEGEANIGNDDDFDNGAGGASATVNGPPYAAVSDTVTFTADSGDVTLDENTATLASFGAPSYAGTFDLGAFTLDVDGYVLLDGTVNGTGTIDCGAHLDQTATVADAVALDLTGAAAYTLVVPGTGGQINFKAAGTYTVQTAIDCYGLDLTGGAGTFDFADHAVTVNGGGFNDDGTATVANPGDLIFAADTAVASGAWNVIYAGVTVNVDATVTLSNYILARDWDIKGEVVTSAGNYPWIRPNTATAWTQTGTISGDGLVNLQGSDVPAGGTTLGDIDVGADARIRVGKDTNGQTLTLQNVTGEYLDLANGSGAADVQVTGDLTFTGVADGGILYTENGASVALGSGTHSMAGNIERAAAETGCSLDLETCTLELGGTLDGDGLTVTSTGAHVHGGTVENTDVDASNIIHLFGGAQGAGNGAGVVDCPSPISGAAAVMAA